MKSPGSQGPRSDLRVAVKELTGAAFLVLTAFGSQIRKRTDQLHTS